MPELREPVDAESVIVKVKYAGVCGSDRGIWFREAWRDGVLESLAREKKDMRIIGHECFGEIVAVGSAVERTHGFRVGDAVAAESHVTCGRCYQCQRGELHVCTTEQILGISFDGCFAEYVKVPSKILWKTDTKKIRPEIAVLHEPFGNAVYACTKVDLRGKRVAIIGCGPIGLFTALIARAFGASQIIGVEPNPAAAALATELGVDCIITPEKSDPARPWARDEKTIAAILAATNGVGVDVAIEMSGYNSSVNTAIFATRRGGDVILFGLKTGDFTLQGFDRMIARGVTLHCIIGRELFRTWQTTQGLLENTSNGIQDKLWRVLLREGKGTILPFASYDPASFEAAMRANTKILVQF